MQNVPAVHCTVSSPLARRSLLGRVQVMNSKKQKKDLEKMPALRPPLFA
jgi:hypothetical protein